ncbi:unnamed protein product [Rotaria sp. Silwood2]|nr:unnamed protein product [Rotaria sp. Silwood2]
MQLDQKVQQKKCPPYIDIYEKISLVYRTSLLISLKFSFLPVHRIALEINIPHTSHKLQICSNQQSVHGACIQYSNGSKGVTFCKCNQGWSGQYCTCSSDSLCMGVVANNRLLCVCPSNQNPTCYNGGQCIPIDKNIIPNKQFICICQKGFSGKKCEIADNKIIVSFHKSIILPQSIFIRFIEVINDAVPENGLTFKTISVNQNSITIFWSRPFHIIFAKFFDNNYYLITVQKTYNRSSAISTIVKPSVCQQASPLLSCCYDNDHFCLCNNYGKQRLANCFEFNHSGKFDCFGQSNCENGAQCLQDRRTCSHTSVCVCLTCFYEKRYEFSSSGFDL